MDKELLFHAMLAGDLPQLNSDNEIDAFFSYSPVKVLMGYVKILGYTKNKIFKGFEFPDGNHYLPIYAEKIINLTGTFEYRIRLNVLQNNIVSTGSSKISSAENVKNKILQLIEEGVNVKINNYTIIVLTVSGQQIALFDRI